MCVAGGVSARCVSSLRELLVEVVPVSTSVGAVAARVRSAWLPDCHVVVCGRVCLAVVGRVVAAGVVRVLGRASLRRT